MSKSIFEEEGKNPSANNSGNVSTAQRQIEKQARQLAYDTRYQVKKQIGGKPVNADAMKRLLIQRLQKSTAAPNVKLRAKQMLLGEDYIGNVSNFASDTVANALIKVFVDKPIVSESFVSKSVENEYIHEMDQRGERKYKVRVTDKKTGNSYIRFATREKITQLRTNPNIQSVEITEYGEPREGEKNRGEATAKTKSGKGLDPVGKEDKDIDNDGDHDKSDKYLLKRRKAIGKAMKIRKEEFIADAVGRESNTTNTSKIDVLGKGKKNNVVVFPNDTTTDRQGTGSATPKSVYAHTEMNGEVLFENGYSKFLKKVQKLEEMSVSINQQQASGAALSAKRGKTDPSKLKGAARGMYYSMTEKQLRDFAKTKHKGLPEKVEEEVNERDTRADKSYREVIKNKLRALGAKNAFIDTSDEDLENVYDKIATSDMVKNEKLDKMCEGMGLSIGASRALGKIFSNSRTSESDATRAAQRNITDPVGNAIKGTVRSLGANYGSESMKEKRRPQTPVQKSVAARTQQVLNQSHELKGEVLDELRRSEKEGKGSPETGLAYPGRAFNRERGARGGRHHYSGSVEFGGSASERGKKKKQPGSQHQRLNPPEKKGRQLERGSRAATERAYGYGQGRYQGD